MINLMGKGGGLGSCNIILDSPPLSRVRANALTEKNMKSYFDLLEKTLEDNGLLNKPARTYNMDKSGMPLDHKQLKRVAEKGTKKVHGAASGDKSQITLVTCANAAGHVLPPMLIFKGERLNHEWTKGEVPNTLYGMSENGWIDQDPTRTPCHVPNGWSLIPLHP